MDTAKLFAAHERDCINPTGRTIELEIIACIVDGKTGECIKHDFADGETVEVRCEGCDALLWAQERD